MMVGRDVWESADNGEAYNGQRCHSARLERLQGRRGAVQTSPFILNQEPGQRSHCSDYATDGTTRSSITDWANNFSSSPKTSRPALGAHPASHSAGSGVLSQRARRPEREINNSPPSSAKAKNEWSYTFPPPTCLHDVDRNVICTFTILNLLAPDFFLILAHSVYKM